MATKLKGDPYGKIVGFHGAPVIHGIEEPHFGSGTGQFLPGNPNDYISIEGFAAGVGIHRIEGSSGVCFCLHDKWNTLVYQWPDYYTPTREDVQVEVFKYLKSIGRSVF